MANKSVFMCSDGHRLVYNLWLPEEGKKIKAYLQILHGMAEHSNRYEKFAKYLNKADIAVFAADHRGHGDTASEDELGWFAETDGWNRIAADAFELANYITSFGVEAPTYLFGHSMGSFLARTIICRHPDYYSGVIVMGTGCSKGLVGKIGKQICKSQINKFGSKAIGRKLNSLVFGAYAKSVPNAITDFDWLSRDEHEVEKYIADPKCGFICTNGFYYDLLCGVEIANNPKNASLLPHDLPMLIISGDCDPVGDMGKGVTKVYEFYKKAGIADLTLYLVPEARHELLNETNKKEIYSYLLNWIESRIY